MDKNFCQQYVIHLINYVIFIKYDFRILEDNNTKNLVEELIFLKFY